MEKSNNVVSATTANGSKSEINNNNVENTNSQMAKMESVENGEVSGEDVVVEKTWSQLMHVDNVEGYVGYSEEAKNKIKYECCKFSSERMKKMAKRRNVKSYRILKPNGEETNSFVRANCGNLSVVKYVDGTEEIYIKLYNEEADDLWWYLVDESYLDGYCVVEYLNNNSELDNAVVECMEALDEMHGAEYDEEHRSGYSIELDDEIADNLYNARTQVIERGRNLEDIITNVDADYLIDEYDGSGFAVWMGEKYTVVKFLIDEEFNRYRCYLKPFAGVVEWMEEVGENNWAFYDGERHIPADIVSGHLDEIYICQR